MISRAHRCESMYASQHQYRINNQSSFLQNSAKIFIVPDMHLIIGLGNPEKKYELTRHNMGFIVVDELAKQLQTTFKNKTSFEAEVADPTIHPLTKGRITIMKPQTFMNVSGRAVKLYVSKHKISTNNLLIVYDDADLPFGDIRYKTSGSSGGHNGMQSIQDVFPKGTSIARVRVGIGRPPNPDVPLDAFVLQKFTDEEKKKLPEIIKSAIAKIQEKIASQ